MLKPEDNALLTRVEGDAPMGRMLRECYWVPAVRAARLVADDPPIRVPLLGRNYVAFRASDGRVGFFDEACPHRGASLALARNADCALRCIFHGIRIDVSGRVTDIPCEPLHADRLAAQMKVNAYPVRETGGLVWVYLGSSDSPPEFPELDFTRLAGDRVVVVSAPLPCNWVQGLEATLDSAHVAILHQSYVGRMAPLAQLTAESAPVYDVEPTDFGLRAYATRALPDGRKYVRLSNFVMPFVGLTAPNDPEGGHRAALMTVPIDDTRSTQWFVRFNTGAPADAGFGVGAKDYDPDDFAPLPGGADNHWGQDRDAVRAGHFTGFTRHHLVEDMAVQASMGPIVDRSKEFLLPSDLAIVALRRALLAAVRDFEQGRRPKSAGPGIDYGAVRSTAAVIGADDPVKSVN